jgi:D-serine deaminase-like pyridoxal phosphate-dependent protein
MTSANWYTIENIDELDSPALLIYRDRVQENIRRLVGSVDDIKRLRPHVKTHKSAEVTAMLLDAGITKFKCATIAEAEMLASTGVADILLAYQPVGPKADRLADLTQRYPHAKFSCLIDNLDTAKYISNVFEHLNKVIEVFIDLNVGMNRTGIVPQKAIRLYDDCLALTGIKITGLHAYDGHLRDVDYATRKKNCDEGFRDVQELKKEIETKHHNVIKVVAGGTPTFSIHSKRNTIECSPGTCIYWDKGYEQGLPEQHYLHAALVVTRVISKPTKDSICIDLGHKAIASENPIQNRVFFLYGNDLQPVGHSEEHMVLKTQKADTYHVGDVLYGIPYHVCPTVALYDKAFVVEDHRVVTSWNTLSRNRKISV